MGHAPTMVWHKDADFETVDLIVLPGGFSYGDYLRCGAMAAHSPVMRELVERAGRGVPLGICTATVIATWFGGGTMLGTSNKADREDARDIERREFAHLILDKALESVGDAEDLHALLDIVVRSLQEQGRFAGVHGGVVEVQFGHGRGIRAFKAGMQSLVMDGALRLRYHALDL